MNYFKEFFDYSKEKDMKESMFKDCYTICKKYKEDFDFIIKQNFPNAKFYKEITNSPESLEIKINNKKSDFFKLIFNLKNEIENHFKQSFKDNGSELRTVSLSENFLGELFSRLIYNEFYFKIVIPDEFCNQVPIVSITKGLDY